MLKRRSNELVKKEVGLKKPIEIMDKVGISQGNFNTNIDMMTAQSSILTIYSNEKFLQNTQPTTELALDVRRDVLTREFEDRVKFHILNTYNIIINELRKSGVINKKYDFSNLYKFDIKDVLESIPQYVFNISFYMNSDLNNPNQFVDLSVYIASIFVNYTNTYMSAEYDDYSGMVRRKDDDIIELEKMKHNLFKPLCLGYLDMFRQICMNEFNIYYNAGYPNLEIGTF